MPPRKQGRARPDKRAALYHRVSTREQNPALARAELRQAARSRGLRVVLDVEETASAGKGALRPGLNKILDAAHRGDLDVVIVQRLDRWGRSTLDLLANIRKLRAAGVTFVAVAQGLEVRPAHDAVSDLTLTVLAAAAEFERAVIVERTLDGLAAARRRGVKLGRPPSRRTPRYERVADLRAVGRSWAEIAKTVRSNASTVRYVYLRGPVKKDYALGPGTSRRGGRRS
jgi:DNA invertase Pin-like site-specific DNA recombinase